MEPMVLCALGIVVYCSYLTVKDIITDLQQEGFSMKSLFTSVSIFQCFPPPFQTRQQQRPKKTTKEAIYVFYPHERQVS